MKTNLFECKIGDNVYYSRSGVKGHITDFKENTFVTILWDFDGFERYQTVDSYEYENVSDWKMVFQYDSEQELFALRLKYPIDQV